MKKDKKRDFARIFNMNNVLGKVISWGAYIIVLVSVLVLTYLSFVETFKFTLDWKTIGIFSGATTLLAWTCWNTFYHKQYEKLMDEDINQQSEDRYSIHARYYMAIKDWKDVDLQMAIDKFNKEYTQKWLDWVESTTGVPVETRKEKFVDPITGEEIREIKGIKELRYKGFKHKLLMWRIKNHKYPQSGYKTSMELMSLFSYQDANFNKRNIQADKKFYVKHSASKLIISILILVTGASLLPEMISGGYWTAVLKLALAICSLISGVFMGAINGIRGARLKLSIVEDACFDLEHWADKKPIVEPYIEPIKPKDNEQNEFEPTDKSKDIEVTSDIFSKLKISK